MKIASTAVQTGIADLHGSSSEEVEMIAEGSLMRTVPDDLIKRQGDKNQTQVVQGYVSCHVYANSNQAFPLLLQSCSMFAHVRLS